MDTFTNLALKDYSDNTAYNHHRMQIMQQKHKSLVFSFLTQSRTVYEFSNYMFFKSFFVL